MHDLDPGDDTHATLAATLWPAHGRGYVRHLVLALLGSLFVALRAQIQLPFKPVPITLQTFAVLLVGVAFGSRLGTATLVLYVVAGAAGLPVFAGFEGGFAVFAGPMGGTMAGFVFAAAATGYLAERGWDRDRLSAGAVMMLGTVVIYLPALLWLSRLFDWDKAVAIGLTPFLLGDALKVLLAMVLVPFIWRLVRRRGA